MHYSESEVMNEKLENYNSFSQKLANPAEGWKDDIYIIQFILHFAPRLQKQQIRNQPPKISKITTNHQKSGHSLHLI